MNSWLVRADWNDAGSQFERFIHEKIWENGYSNKFIEIVNAIEIGDTLYLADKSEIKYSAKCSKNYNDGRKIEVEEWMSFDKPIYFPGKGAYSQTIARVASEKNLFKILKEESSRKLSKASLSVQVKESDSIYLDSIKVEDYFSIEDMTIENLKDKKEIYFVGENGEGKTVLLQAILLALKGSRYNTLEYIDDNTKSKMKLAIKDDIVSKYQSYRNIKNVFAYGINRNKVREKFDPYGYMGIFDTSDFKDTTFLKNPTEILKSDNNIIEDFVDKLNSYILKDKLHIVHDLNTLVFKEAKYEIEFEKLSEGYKSTIIWLCDLVSRLIENQPNINKIEDFKAIVIIDEIDLYLHPKWEYDLVNTIRKIFPNIQFIMTTHSMVTILGASKDAVFYKVYKENGKTKLTHPMNTIKNLMANNLSTSPLFNLNTARARNNDGDIDTSEDFLYTKIHQAIAEKVKDKKTVIEDDIMKLINEELSSLDKERK